MKSSYDPAKSERNVAERGLPFHLAAEFEWGLALIFRDGRKDYGEHRYLALGSIGERLHVLVFILRGDTVHVISLRKANRREMRRYATQAGPGTDRRGRT